MKNNEQEKIKQIDREEQQNKNLMFAMYALIITNLAFYILVTTIIGIYVEEGPMQGVLIGISIGILLIAAFMGLKIEADAGYYKCPKCNHKFVPEYKKVLMAKHYWTTRHLKCPQCGQKTWCKKVMSKEE